MSVRTADAIVLHVDDDPDLTDVFSSFLERKSDWVTARSAQSAAEALDVLSETDVDCIVSDYHMPGMDGLALLRRVRENYPELPFVLFTSEGSEELASEAVSLGLTDYFRKGETSVQYGELVVCVERAIEKYYARQRSVTL
jgi:DNA-binding NtrC family response regulator